MSTKWDDIRERAIEIAQDAKSTTEVAQKCSKLLDRTVSVNAVGKAFSKWKQRGLANNLLDYVVYDEEVPFPSHTDPPPSVVEMHKMRVERKSLKRLLREAIREAEAAENRLEFVEALTPSESIPQILPREKTSGIREVTPIFLASDWHVEEEVNPATINGANEYDLNIATERAGRFFDGVIWMFNWVTQDSKRMVARDLVLGVLGDMITGYIHEELEESNFLSPTEATLFAQNLLINGIDYILEELPIERLVIPCTYGNHGRVQKRKRHATGAKNSFEWLMYQTLASHYRNHDRVEFYVASGAHLYLDIYDTSCRFHHGDDVRYYGGVGGLSIPMNKALDSWDEFRYADQTFVGHWHQYQAFRRCLVNGSLIGYGPYALSIKARFELPQQAMCLIDSKRGRAMTAPIWVD